MPTVLITGANRGIGLEFAHQYAADGWDVIATARQSSPELEALGVRAESLDLSDADTVAGFAQKIEGPLDLFIANAGTSQPRDTEGADNAREWQAMMMVNASPTSAVERMIPAIASSPSVGSNNQQSLRFCFGSSGVVNS